MGEVQSANSRVPGSHRDDDETRSSGTPGVLARDSPGEPSGSSLRDAEEAPSDEHGYPMISPLVERLTSVDVAEVFSPPRVTEEAKEFGLKAGEAWDLTEGWDFRIGNHRKAALRYQDEHKPVVLIGSPPCTPFSQLQTMNPRDDKSTLKWDEGVEHMKFVIQLYRNQLKAGRVFLHEHLASAKCGV